MTVATTGVSITYTGTGANTPLAFPHDFENASDIVVVRRVTATGAESIMGLDTEYSVTGGGGGGGTVTPITGSTFFTAAVTWTLLRRTPLTQLTDYVRNDALDAETIEADLDRLSAVDQEAAERLDRAIKYPRSESNEGIPSVLPSVADRASKVFVFAADGSPGAAALSELSPGTVVVGTYGQSILALATKAAWQADLNLIQQAGGMAKLEAGLESARPSPASHPSGGAWLSTDSRRWYYAQSPTVWAEMGIVRSVNSTLAPVVLNRLVLDIENEILYRDTGAALNAVRGPLPRGWISGFNLSLSGSDKNVDIGPGQCRVGTSGDPDIANVITTSTVTKKLDTAGGWVAGTNQAGRPSAVPLSTNAWYHVFEISKADGTKDAGFDTSVTAANLLAESGYTYYRRIGSVRTTGVVGGAMLPFIQHGDLFVWQSPPNADIVQVAQDFTGADYLRPVLHAPLGVRTEAILNVGFDNMSTSGSIRAGGATIGASPARLGNPVGNWGDFGSQIGNFQIRALTNTGQQVSIRINASDTSVTFWIAVEGYVDARGRHD